MNVYSMEGLLNKMENQFYLKLQSVFEQLGDHAKIVLATSNRHNKVSARNMCFIMMKNQFYFQTDQTFRKYQDLKENNQVALCINNIQIEGICEELGHPLDHIEFIDLFKKHFKSSYEAYSSLPSEQLFVVKPTFIQRWSYIDDQAVIEQFEFDQQIYRVQHYPVD